jgi:hypothetical protein
MTNQTQTMAISLFFSFIWLMTGIVTLYITNGDINWFFNLSLFMSVLSMVVFTISFLLED